MQDSRVAEINSNKALGLRASDAYAERRREMVETQIRGRGVTDGRVLEAMGTVPRHEFVPPQFRDASYSDEPLGIGDGQTISQPYIVASMCAALALNGTEKVLEIGTGSGYHAAILSTLARVVYTVECRAELATSAAGRLQQLGFDNVHVRYGDGTLGLKEVAPFDAILVAAAAPALPKPLLEQLAEGGRMIVPIGAEKEQRLILIVHQGNEFVSERRESCRFVPLVGHYGWKD
jgi:protein-L-isoaspartate(D-aspartate) O-methyltransferase